MATLDETIVTTLLQAGVEGMAISDLIQSLGTGTEDSIRKRASEMTKSGVLERLRRGKYRVSGFRNQEKNPNRVVTYNSEGAGPLTRAASLVKRLQETVTFDLLPNVSAGRNPLVFDEQSRISVTLPRAFVRQFLGFDPPSVMGVSEVSGDSMWPTLHEGDLVLYNLNPDVEGAGLYVVMLDGKQICKRVQSVGRGYRIISENRMAGYTTEILRYTAEGFVHLDTGDVVEFGIVGRILFPRPETARIQTEHLAHLLKQMFSEAAG